MRVLITLILVTLCDVALLVVGDNSEPLPICVIGGGPAGVYTAYNLEQKGYTNVILFEKGSQLGGKTVPYNDGVLPFGYIRHLYSVAMTEIDYVNTLVGPVPKLDLPPTTLFNSTHPNVPIPGATLEIQLAIQKYLQIVSDPEFAAMVYTGYHPADTPSELHVPFRTWLAANGISILEPVMYNTMTNYGYGYFDSIAAIYMLKYFSPGTFMDVITRNYKLMPMHLLIQGIGATLSNVKLNAEVTSARYLYLPKKWKIKFTEGSGESETIHCGHVVYAAAPLLSALELFENWMPLRKQLFSMVERSNYFEFVVSNVPDGIFPPGAAAHTWELVPSDEPNLYIKYFSGGKVLLLMQTREAMSTDDAFSKVKNHFSQVFGHEMQASDIAFVKDWDYFPRASPDTLLNTEFYQRFENQQGRQKLYFVSGLNDFELVDSALKSAKRLVNMYF